MPFAVFVVQIEHTVNGFCFLAGCLRKSLCGSARRRAKRNPLSQILEQFEYALDDCRFTRSGTAGDYLHSVFDGFSDCGDLIFVKRKACVFFESCDFVLYVHSKVGSLLL